MFKYAFLFLILAVNLHAVKFDSTIHKNKCVSEGCDQAADQVCGRCKSVHYCTVDHQKIDWPTHKLQCQPKVPVKVVKLTPHQMAEAEFLALRPKPLAVVAGQEQSLVAAALAYISARGDEKTILIVGCGQDPYGWQEEKSPNNTWRNTQVSNAGDHSHKDAFTIAEDAKVRPNGLWDWLNPIPKALHGLFDVVYFEKLPPRVLAQSIVFTNAMQALKIGGKLELDLQTAFGGNDGVDDVYCFKTPFEIIAPQTIIELIQNPTPEGGLKVKREHALKYASLSAQSDLVFKQFLEAKGFTYVMIFDQELNPYNARTRKTKTGIGIKR